MTRRIFGLSAVAAAVSAAIPASEPIAVAHPSVQKYGSQTYGETITVSWETVLDDDLIVFAESCKLRAQSAVRRYARAATAVIE